ncbi:MAG TPA: 30S ribosomal protein S17 [Candidatus Nanoarchaeia archaeon]|nr:30S ribosomal protein S17 [Candidatus Nanoarchaeia archaeon]
MKKNQSKNIGVKLEAPKETCTDDNCPFHGNLSVRGRQLSGTVISAKMRKTAVMEFERLNFVKKYERYEKRRTRLKVHNTDCVNAKEGDKVLVMECRPLSKAKNFVIIQKTGTERGFKDKMAARELSKVPVKKEVKEEKKVEE